MNDNYDFDLTTLVREVCDDTDTPDPALLTKEVYRRLRHGERDAALLAALEVFVMQYVTRRRHYAIPGGQSTRDTQTGAAAGGRSTKVAAIRSYARALRDRVAVGDGEWKFLADCTAGDLTYAAGLRREHAKATLARADQYERLAALLTRCGVSTVGALPDEVLAEGLDAA